eukprot:70208-Prymnesium_polylepis.1
MSSASLAASSGSCRVPGGVFAEVYGRAARAVLQRRVADAQVQQRANHPLVIGNQCSQGVETASRPPVGLLIAGARRRVEGPQDGPSGQQSSQLVSVRVPSPEAVAHECTTGADAPDELGNSLSHLRLQGVERSVVAHRHLARVLDQLVVATRGRWPMLSPKAVWPMLSPKAVSGHYARPA